MTGQNRRGRNNNSLFHFIAIVICARQTACLINEKLAVEPTVGTEHLSLDTTEVRTNASFADFTLPFACGNKTHNCLELCSLCNDLSHGPTMECLFVLLNHFCLKHFHTVMNHSSTKWCVWGNVSGLYNDLSLCTEEISDCLLIPWPNPLVEQTFLDIHSQYFEDCPSEELSDPPPAIIFALVITPICLIPVMVSLVVLKTKNGDGTP